MWELRCRFNRGGYWRRVRTGKLTTKILDSNHPAPEGSHQPHCTLSQMISYMDSSGQELVRVHMYLLPDGTIGGSGKPDPKLLYEDGVLYAAYTREQAAAAPRPWAQRFLPPAVAKVVLRLWGPLRCFLLGR